MRPPVRRAAITLGAGVVLLCGGCAGSDPPPAAAPSTGSPSPTATPDPPPPAPPVEPGGAEPAAPRMSACPEQAFTRLGEQERVGQLFMVAVTPSGGAAVLDSPLRRHHVGGVIYLGGWRTAPTVAGTSAALQEKATNGVGLLVAADQEGGQVQQLRGTDFTTLPTGLRQGELPRPELTDLWTGAGEQLAAAGVNVDLAPVADVVAAGTESANAPIGRYQRHLGSDPAQVASAVEAVVTGLARSKVTATVKHFPGLGRVHGNTDVTDQDITDDVAGPDDANLGPFRAGIAAGAGMVMVSSARYPRLDPHHQALFSPAVIAGLLRGTLGYAGVVVSDDVGAAAAVAGTPVGERATRFLAAGGDVVLTADAGNVPAMVAAVEERSHRDPAFARQVHASARRVLVLKERMGLLRCG